MKRAVPLLILSTLLLAVFAADAFAKDEQTLSGEYMWEGGGNRGTLRAVFTPTGQDLWDVSFHFSFSGQSHVYAGTAEGSLTEGTLEGKVLDDNQRNSYTFKGAFKDGRFKGTHAQYRRDKEYRTGTLTLGR
jgi:hypothetical protein